jgi:hypothetical protein
LTVSTPEPPSPLSDVPLAVRAQLLATEHWSLLATRGTTWSEVMSRITIHLTVSSAALVVLALVAQASGFGTAFTVLSIGLTAAILVLGTLTSVRVMNASQDDANLILGMNRLRAAYVEIDPSLSRYLVTGTTDDMAGLMATYLHGTPRSLLRHIVGSTSFFMHTVNTIVAGSLGAVITNAAGGSPALITVVGVVAGLAHLGVAMFVSQRAFATPKVTPLFPSR